MPGTSKLSPLQLDLVEAFFARDKGFFLTGGAALAGYYLHHRRTQDLDLFATADSSIESGVRALRAAAGSIGADLESIQESQDFRRFAATRAEETTLVDLVIDRAPQAFADKVVRGTIRIDPIREIAANKLCVLLDRMEVRDLVDLQLLLAGGLTLEQVLEDARKKHAGADPATLAWLLEQFHVPDDHPAMREAGISADALRTFRDALIEQLTRLALPPV